MMSGMPPGVPPFSVYFSLGLCGSLDLCVSLLPVVEVSRSRLVSLIAFFCVAEGVSLGFVEPCSISEGWATLVSLVGAALTEGVGPAPVVSLEDVGLVVEVADVG